MDTNHNSILIGKNGRTLAAINQLVKLAATTRFKRRVRVLVDINDYKNQRYSKVISIAKRVAREVRKTKIDVTLDPMVADERRAVHNALSNYTNIATESVGERNDRRIVVKYVENE
jgi:spoIIIJ-associated protein